MSGRRRHTTSASALRSENAQLRQQLKEHWTALFSSLRETDAMRAELTALRERNEQLELQVAASVKLIAKGNRDLRLAKQKAKKAKKARLVKCRVHEATSVDNLHHLLSITRLETQEEERAQDEQPTAEKQRPQPEQQQEHEQQQQRGLDTRQQRLCTAATNVACEEPF